MSFSESFAQLRVELEHRNEQTASALVKCQAELDDVTSKVRMLQMVNEKLQTQATETATETQKKLEHLSVTAQKSNNELFETQAKWAKLQEHSEKESASSMQKSQADSQAFQATIAKLEEQLDLQARLQARSQEETTELRKQIVQLQIDSEQQEAALKQQHAIELFEAQKALMTSQADGEQKDLELHSSSEQIQKISKLESQIEQQTQLNTKLQMTSDAQKCQVEEMKSDRALLTERAKVVNEEAAAEIRRSAGVCFYEIRFDI